MRIVTNMAESGEGTADARGRTATRLPTGWWPRRSVPGLGETVPAFAIADYVELARPTVTLLHIADHTSLARDYALAAEANDPLLHDWLGEPAQPARIIELTDPNANPWQNGAVLFTPLREAPTATLQLLLLPAQVAARFHSPHAWIQDGLERFLQTVAVERRSGRTCGVGVSRPISRAAGASRRSSASETGRGAKSSPDSNAADNTLLNTNDELYLRGKGSFVFWMLRDMVGDDSHAVAPLPPIAAAPTKIPSYLSGCCKPARSAIWSGSSTTGCIAIAVCPSFTWSRRTRGRCSARPTRAFW